MDNEFLIFSSRLIKPVPVVNLRRPRVVRGESMDIDIAFDRLKDGGSRTPKMLDRKPLLDARRIDA